MHLRKARPEDATALAKMRHALWPHSSVEKHGAELTRILGGAPYGTLPWLLLVAELKDGALVGFLEAGLRSTADGCDPAVPVGYVEGWYVAPEWRRRKVGAALVAEAESWAREQGCREMASDTWLDNVDSQRAHQALGYEEVDRCVHYRKKI
jgi:aminoglycoside 6'-N-acetyltransferase I